MINQLYKNRFELFFFSVLAILFGSLVIPKAFFDTVMMPVFMLVNIASGILLMSKKKKLMLFFIVTFGVALFIFGRSMIYKQLSDSYRFIRLIIYFLFYLSVTLEIINQVWKASFVNKNVIIGLMSGYICLGLIGFFIFSGIEMAVPDSFKGFPMGETNLVDRASSLLYFSYITLLTIGYGQIVPVTAIGQKAVILIGLVGQFYIIILTAMVVEKYIRHSRSD